MKKFSFTLGRLLDYKDQVLETEKNLLRQLHQKKFEIDSSIEELERMFAETDRKQKEKEARGIFVGQIRMYEYEKDSIRNQLKQLRIEQKRAEIEVDRQVKVVVAASQEVAGLDKLKEKQLEEYQHQVAKADEDFISEYISGKLIRQAQ
ncbi:MAG: FliJ family protein [Oscillospiraceae bacterium]|nr:FliJ family protein [Oscillospiraceae bacterium]